MTTTLTILVADDHPMFRAAVAHMLGAAFPEVRVIEAASRSALEAALLAESAIDLVLLDLAMPGAIGFSSLLWLRAERPDLPVMVISSNDRPRTVRRAQQFGAALRGGFDDCATVAKRTGCAGCGAGRSFQSDGFHCGQSGVCAGDSGHHGTGGRGGNAAGRRDGGACAAAARCGSAAGG